MILGFSAADISPEHAEVTLSGRHIDLEDSQDGHKPSNRRGLRVGGDRLDGWKAQTSAPDFEVVVNAPGGETTIECVRACKLAWVERGVNAIATPTQSFKFACGGTADSRCSSFKVGGWIKP